MRHWIFGAVVTAIGLGLLFVGIEAHAATTAVQPANGGTGSNSVPSYGQVLVGNGSGIYTPVATSSLGIGATANAGGAPGQLQFNSNGSLAGVSTSSITCSGSASCGAGSYVIGNPLTITVTGGGGNSFGQSFEINAAGYLAPTTTKTVLANGGLVSQGSSTVVGTLNVSGLNVGSLGGFLKAVAGAVSTALVNLATDVTGTLGVGNGGTASTTLTGILKGNGTSGVLTAVGNTDYQLPISLTTTGSSGAATFNGTTLNIPQYASSGASTTLLGDSNHFTGANTFTSTITGSISGNAGTATTLAANGTNCAAGTYPLGIDASGNVESCTYAVATSSPWAANQIVYINNTGQLVSVASSSLNLPDSALQHSSVTINGTNFNLGDTKTIAAASSTLLTDTNTFGSTQTFNNVTITGTCTGCSSGAGITTIGPLGQGQTGATQTLATSTLGSDFTITASGNTQTFNLPFASGSTNGKLSSTDWTTFNNKLGSVTADYPLQGLGTAGSHLTLAFGTTTGNTWGSTQTFTNPLIDGTLNGLIAGNSGQTYAVATSSLNASITGSAGSVANALTFNNSGSGDASGSTFNGSAAKTLSYNSIGAVPATRNITTTFPILGGGDLSTDRILTFAGLSTSTAAVVGNIPYFSGANTFANVATTSVSCSGSVSCTTFAAIGPAPITITGSGGGSTFPFIPTTYKGTTVNSTSTPLYLTATTPFSLIASSTFATFASTTNLQNLHYVDTTSPGDLGANINNTYNNLCSGTAACHVQVSGNGTTTFSTEIAATTKGKPLYLTCDPGVVLQWTGSATSTVINETDVPNGQFPQLHGVDDCNLYHVNTGAGDTSVAIELGGTNGAPNVSVQYDHIKGFGLSVATENNVWLPNISNDVFEYNNRDFWAQGTSNTGEQFRMDKDNFSDCNDINKCVYFPTSSTASVDFSGDTLDSAQLYIADGNLSFNVFGLHIENPSQVASYTPIVIESGGFTKANFFGGLTVISGADAGHSFPQIILNGSRGLIVNGMTVQNDSGSFTIAAVVNNFGNGSLLAEGLGKIGGTSPYTTIATSSIFLVADNLNSLFAIQGTASSTNLTISGVANCSGSNALTTNSSGTVSCGAITGGGGSSFGYPFPSNATTTALTFGGVTDSALSSGLVANNGGTLYSFASSSLFGYTPLNPTRSLTINGTANQITSSAGAQDLSADRTWTLSFPNLVVFPSNASSTLFSTSYASSTQYFGAGLASCNGGSSALTYDGAGRFGCNTITSGNSFGYPFPTLGIGTSTGLMLLASSTIGNGSSGLTISGAATTTGQAVFPFNTTTFPHLFFGDNTNNTDFMFAGAGGRFMEGYDNSGSEGRGVIASGDSKGLEFFTGATNNTMPTQSGSTPAMVISGGVQGTLGAVGIGTTSPYASLSVVGSSGVVADHYVATSTTATSSLAAGLSVTGVAQAIYKTPGFTMSTTTGWTGTSTQLLPSSIVNDKLDAIACYTDTGTLTVQVGNGSASTTVIANSTNALTTVSSNNVFSALAKRFLAIGSPLSSPAQITCTLKLENTAF